MVTSQSLWGVLDSRDPPVHAAWFCAGPEHFASMLVPAIRQATRGGHPVHVLAPQGYASALVGGFGGTPPATLTVTELKCCPREAWDPAPLEMSSRTWIVHVAAAGEADAPGAGADEAKAVTEDVEGWLDRLAASGPVRVLCVYDLDAVDRWKADETAQVHHRWLATLGRLVSFNDVLPRQPLSLPGETLPPALARSAGSGAGGAHEPPGAGPVEAPAT